MCQMHHYNNNNTNNNKKNKNKKIIIIIININTHTNTLKHLIYAAGHSVQGSLPRGKLQHYITVDQRGHWDTFYTIACSKLT